MLETLKMKKIALLILAVVALYSCSKDENIVKPVDGQYIAGEFDSFLYCLVLDNGKCIDFAMFHLGKKAVNLCDNVSTSGHFPNYEYRGEDSFTMEANFESTTAFTAILSGGFLVGSLYWSINTFLKFKLDNRMLDANGDGILDDMQSDLSDN